MSFPLTTCKYCSEVSKASGEDPIGSASPIDGWLVMELPLPWTEDRFHHDPLLRPIHDLFHAIFERGIQIMPMAIAPDRDYEILNRAHVFYYRRPSQRFPQFEKQTFLLPLDQIILLAKALTIEPETLPQFLRYQQPADGIRDIMVCTHGNIDIACARFGYPIYKQLKQIYSLPLSPSPSAPLRVWRCSHFGGHQFAPTLMDFPTGQAWGHLNADILPALIKRDRPVSELKSFYRGQSGLPEFVQIVEREIWMQHGWEWLSYGKVGQILAQDENAEWADVRLEFTAPDSHHSGIYEARVEACGTVTTAYNSGDTPTSARQYQVSRLTQVSV